MFPLYSLMGTRAVSCWKEMVNFFSTAENAPSFFFYFLPPFM